MVKLDLIPLLTARHMVFKTIAITDPKKVDLVESRCNQPIEKPLEI